MPKLKPTDIEPTSDEDAAIRAGIAVDADTWELTGDDFARMKPASELTPQIVERAARRRGPQTAPPPRSELPFASMQTSPPTSGRAVRAGRRD